MANGKAAGAAQAAEEAHSRCAAATPASTEWAEPGLVYDFVFDHCADGQQLKCLTVADEFTKEGLAIDVDGRIRSGRVIEVLSRLVSAPAPRGFCVATTGLSSCLRHCCLDRHARHRHGIDRTRQAWQNGVAESFNGKFRDGV